MINPTADVRMLWKRPVKCLATWCLTILCFATWPGAGQAQNLIGKMGATSFNLVLPAGYCVPDKTSANQRFFVDLLAKGLENSKDRLIAVGADCTELQNRSKNSAAKIFDYVAYYFVQSEENTSLTGDTQTSRKTVCDDLRGTDKDEAVKDVPKIAKETIKDMKAKGSLQNTKYLGVVDADAHGCYAAILSRIDDGTGNITVMYTIVVRTVLHAKDLWVSFYAEYRDDASAAKLLQLAKTTATALDAKNPE